MRRQRRPAGCRRAGHHAAAAATAGNAGVSGSGSGSGSGAGSGAGSGGGWLQHGAVLELERPRGRSFLCLFWQLAPPYHIDLHPALSKPTAIGKPAGML